MAVPFKALSLGITCGYLLEKDVPMEKRIILAAFLLGAAATHQAAACDWSREAAKQPTVVAVAPTATRPPADCSGAGCDAKQEPAAPILADKPAAPATILACSGTSC